MPPVGKPRTFRSIVIEVGHRFGSRVVVKESESRVRSDGKKERYVEVRCDCGVQTEVALTNLRAGKSTGCSRCHGCHSHGRPVKHGLTSGGAHPYYSVHNSMMHRCYNVNNKDYIYYGGRGISVYKPWHDVVVFLEWLENVLGPKPDASYSLDRINNDGDYEPSNLRWASKKEQTNNRRVFKSS